MIVSCSYWFDMVLLGCFGFGWLIEFDFDCLCWWLLFA